MITVSKILESKTKTFNTIDPALLVSDALNLFKSYNLDYLVVLEGNNYKGLFSESDYTRNVVLKGKTAYTTMVSEAMTVDLPIAATTDTVEHCMRLMKCHRVRYLLVYSGLQFIGVVTVSDLLFQVIDNPQDVFDNAVTIGNYARENSFVY